MGKQTMGTPCHSIQNRTDNKLYRLNFPQSPLVRTKCYDYYNIDDYPIGTNAIVAVVSYTGYDMEDAMVLNKASFERGFAHGTIYSTEIVDLNERSRSSNVIFSRDPRVKALVDVLDDDGLPRVGAFVEPGSPFYCSLDLTTGEYRVQVRAQ
jgi:DNA-directed RNA polymerase I subunit RPA2